jgi:predicted nucleotidyltransferase
MQLFREIREKQLDQIIACRVIVNDFIGTIDTSKLKLIMLSGSVARGTYIPGEQGGAIDLIIFTKDKSYDPRSELGRDIEPHIPGHFIRFKDQHFQIKIYDDSYLLNFSNQSEAEKYAFLESEVLFRNDNHMDDLINKIIVEKVPDEITELFRKAYGYSRYLLNDYKVDRWKNRNAVLQLNMNLHHALNQAIRCFFYINKTYYPAEDRALYFSLNLKKIPADLEEIYNKLLLISDDSLGNYLQRENLFKRKILGFISRMGK